MRVLGIGESILDKYVVEEAGGDGYDTHVTARALDEAHVGGPALSATIFLARLGATCDFMTGIGQDDEGAIIAETLRNEGIMLKGNRQDKTKVNTILVNPKGQRRKTRSRVVHKLLEHIDAAYLAQFDLIIIDRHQRHAFYEIMRKKQPKTKVVIDPSTEVSDFTIDMMKQAEYPIVPIESVAKLGNSECLLASIAKVHDVCGKKLVVTLGEYGCLTYDGHHLEHVPPISVKAVDTNGAGDVYRGAFAYGLLQGWTYRRCAEFANVAAALNCTKLGNVTALPTKSEIDLHLSETPRNVRLHDVDAYFRQVVKAEEGQSTDSIAIAYA